MHVPKHSRHQLPRASWCLVFFDGGRPWMFPCHGLRFFSGQYWCTEISSPVMNCSKKSSPWSLKRRRWVRDAPIRFFLWSSVSCRGTHLLHTFLVVLCQLSRDPPAAHFSCGPLSVVEGPTCCTLILWSSVSCRGTHLLHTFLVVLCQLSRDPPAAHFSAP